MNKKELLQKLNNDFLLKRRKAELFCEQQKEQARLDKEYLTLEIKERNLILNLSKQNFLKQDTTKLQNELNKVNKQLKDRLKALNIDEKSFIPKYECPLCNDMGRINNTYCTCFKQAYNNMLMNDSNISFKDIPNLTNYDTSIFNEEVKAQMQKITTALEKWLNNYKLTKIKQIIFSGATGVGKTYISQILAKESMQKGYSTYYITAFQLNQQMLKYHTTFDEQKETVLKPILESDFLIIDDLGTEPILKNVTLEYLLLILNERNVLNKKTVINTNLAPNHILDRYGERIFSRLMNKQTGLLLKIDGEDLRLKKQS